MGNFRFRHIFSANTVVKIEVLYTWRMWEVRLQTSTDQAKEGVENMQSSTQRTKLILRKVAFQT